MRFFTRDWWSSEGPHADEVSSQYLKHFDSIRSALPRDLVVLHDVHTLHDARVKGIACDFSQRTISLRLEGWNRKFENQVRYVLRFAEVATFEQLLPQEERIGEEFGDLGYWECELDPRGARMCMLFASGAELQVVFRGLELKAQRV